MSTYDPADDNRLEDLPEIVLDVDTTDYIDDELYDMLLDAFVARAKDLGIDVVERKDLVLSDWTIKAKLAYI
jgi:hypothetical protein